MYSLKLCHDNKETSSISLMLIIKKVGVLCNGSLFSVSFCDILHSKMIDSFRGLMGNWVFLL